MRINNLSLPHPVLGKGDDVAGSFNGEYMVELGRDNIIIEFNMHLDNKTLLSMINDKKAAFTIEITCPQTFFRRAYQFQGETFTKQIPSSYLRNKVEVSFFICSLETMPQYKIVGSNSDYAGYDFNIEQGDVLAYGGSKSFFAPKIWQLSGNIGPFMTIEKYNAVSGPVFYDLTMDSIVIKLSTHDFDLYNQLKGIKNYYPTFHASFVYPALIYALKDMASDQNEDKDWYQGLADLMENNDECRQYSLEDEEKIPQLAQVILKYPINRELIGLQAARNTEIEEET